MSYTREGERGFQDEFYKSWHLVCYYRYLRFFSEGRVSMLTCADEPREGVRVLAAKYGSAFFTLVGISSFFLL